MECKSKNLVEYVFKDNYRPSSPKLFRQINASAQFCLPDVKPDIEQIVKVVSEVNVKCAYVIKTPKGTSLEGQIVTGWKVVVEGEVKHIVEYVADETTQSVHAAHFTRPFSNFIVLPEDYIAGSKVSASACIEDVAARQVGCRGIYANATLLLYAAESC